MTIAGFLKSLGRQDKSVFTQSPIFAFLNGQTPPRMGEKEFLMAYKGWVYACVEIIASEAASIEIKLQQSVGVNEWKDINNNPALELLNNVNDFWTSHDLKYATAAFLKLHGNCFWYLPRNNGGKPSEIWVLDPSRTWVVKSETEYIGGYIYQNEKGEKIPLATDEVIHFKKFNPRNPYRGMGTVEAAALAIDTDNFASQWQRNFFGNSAMPSGVLSTDGTLNQDQYDRIRANWDSKFKGVDNAHKMAILEGGLKFQSISPSSKEMEFAQSRKDLRDEILGIFRVSKFNLGILEDVNRASAEAADYYLMKHVVFPEVKFMLSILNEFYLPIFGLDPHKYRFSATDPVPANQELALQVRASAIQNGYMTPNEARAEIGKEPVEGGDELFISNTLVPLSQAVMPADDTTLDSNQDNTDSTKSVKKKLKKGKLNNDKYIEKNVAKLNKVMLKNFATLESNLLEKFNSRKSADKPLLYRLKDIVDTALTSEEANDLVRLLFSDYADWIGLVHNSTEPYINKIYETTGKKVLSKLAADITFSLDNPRAMDFLNNHALEMATQIAESAKEGITLQIMQAVENGAKLEDLGQTIQDYFALEADWRSMRIARTEVINSYNQGSLEGYKQSGVVGGKQWVFDDGDCKSGQCPDNAAAGVIGLDEDFPSGDDAPPAHPNCECYVDGVTKSVDELFSSDSEE